ncbi:uncharacterized protein LOC144772004 [Lissotriton helveticus]
MTHCIVSGWGVMKSSVHNKPDALEEALVDLIPYDTCNSATWYNGALRSHQLCAGNEKGHIPICQGDGGGPLMCLDSETRLFFVIGVTSWGKGCTKPWKPGVYSSTKYFKDWIVKIISRENSTAPPTTEPPIPEPPIPEPPIPEPPIPEVDADTLSPAKRLAPKPKPIPIKITQKGILLDPGLTRQTVPEVGTTASQIIEIPLTPAHKHPKSVPIYSMHPSNSSLEGTAATNILPGGNENKYDFLMPATDNATHLPINQSLLKTMQPETTESNDISYYALESPPKPKSTSKTPPTSSTTEDSHKDSPPVKEEFSSTYYAIVEVSKTNLPSQAMQLVFLANNPPTTIISTDEDVTLITSHKQTAVTGFSLIQLLKLTKPTKSINLGFTVNYPPVQTTHIPSVLLQLFKTTKPSRKTQHVFPFQPPSPARQNAPIQISPALKLNYIISVPSRSQKPSGGGPLLFMSEQTMLPPFLPQNQDSIYPPELYFTSIPPTRSPETAHQGFLNEPTSSLKMGFVFRPYQPLQHSPLGLNLLPPTMNIPSPGSMLFDQQVIFPPTSPDFIPAKRLGMSFKRRYLLI